MALLLFLLVPALNLSGMNASRIQERVGELGIRKAFGATTGTLLCQVLYENGLTTLIGGVVGFGLSLLFFSLGKGFLLESADTSLSGEMLFQPMAFGAALLFCLLLNLLSAGIPALRIARQKIVTALKDGEEFNK
jgi:putative ABC transport system permease protein